VTIFSSPRKGTNILLEITRYLIVVSFVVAETSHVVRISEHGQKHQQAGVVVGAIDREGDGAAVALVNTARTVPATTEINSSNGIFVVFITRINGDVKVEIEAAFANHIATRDCRAFFLALEHFIAFIEAARSTQSESLLTVSIGSSQGNTFNAGKTFTFAGLATSGATNIPNNLAGTILHLPSGAATNCDSGGHNGHTRLVLNRQLNIATARRSNQGSVVDILTTS